MDLDEKLQKDRDYYFNEAGRLVFTRGYLVKRGYCCRNGCQNCPYPVVQSPKSDTT